MRRSSILALIAIMTSLVTRQVQAESALVVLVRPPEQSAIVSEALTRIRGELIADGFDVAVIDAPTGAGAAAVLARADQKTGAAATIGVFLQPDAKAADLWVIDRLTSKTVVRSIEMTEAQAGSAPEVLARRAVELLRASLLEMLVEAREKPTTSPEPRAKASRWVAQALEPRASRWGVEAGAQVLTGFGGVGAALLPVGRVRVVLGRQIGARLTLSGLGTRPHLESGESSATVSQELGLLELLGELAPESRLRPCISLGAGAYHISVDGSASSPYAGLSRDRFVFAGDAGAGLALSLSTSFALALEGHGTLLAPYPVIRFLEVDAARVSNPRVSAALTLVGRL